MYCSAVQVYYIVQTCIPPLLASCYGALEDPAKTAIAKGKIR